MRRWTTCRIWICLGALTVISALAVTAAGEEIPKLSEATQERLLAKTRDPEHPPEDPGAAALYMRQLRTVTDGQKTPIEERLRAAVEHIDNMPRYSTRLGEHFPSLRSATNQEKNEVLGTWRELGPGNIGGRVRALVIDPNRPATMFAAGVSGGIWKTTNSGGTWSQLADLRINIAFNSLAMDPTNAQVLYAGTGEGYQREAVRGTSVLLRGNGIFKTTNGRDFLRLASTASADFHFVNDLVVSAVAPQRVYAATRTGVWRSLNGGTSWQRVLAAGGVPGGCIDLELRQDGASDFLFASCGTLARATLYRNTAAESGAPWQSVLSEEAMGRTSVAIAPSDPNRVYALAASRVPGPNGNFEHGLHAFFRSDQGGAPGTWTAIVRNTDPTKLETLLLSNPVIAHLVECEFGSENRYSNLGWWANMLAVDPLDPNVVWAGGVDIFRSDDGGNNWGVVSYWWDSPPSAHADQHRVVFHPSYNGTSNQTIFVASDGGVWRSDNARAAVATGLGVCNPAASAVRWTSLNRRLGVTQFYHGTPFPDGRSFYGGTQDNGTVLGTLDGGINGWQQIFGGDGGYTAIDPNNLNTLYLSTQWLGLRRSTDGGQSFERILDGITDTQDDTLFITPYLLDPNNSQRLWFGTRRLWRSNNRGTQWTAASPALDPSAKISALAVSPVDPNHVLAGLTNGFVHRNRNAVTATSGSTWARSRPRDGWITALAFDPQNPETVYATYAGFGGQHVWKSEDGGVSWTAIGGSGAGRLPDIPVHAVLVDPQRSERIYLGTDLGAFVTTDGGDTWMSENTGFANAVTKALAIAGGASSPHLFAFTHGRGAWRVPLSIESSGTIELTSAGLETFEGTGEATITVRRTGGAAGAVSVNYSTADGSAIAGSDYTATSGTLTWGNGDAGDRTIVVPILDDSEIEGTETLTVTLADPTGGANLGAVASTTISLLDDDVEPGDCTAGPAVLCLREDRFKVEITWNNFEGASGTGQVVPGTPSDDSGLFWFFAADNWELLVKILDGCGFNDHYWVFFAATTNVGYTLTVTDTEAGRVRFYDNPLGTASPAITDIEAFASCP